MTSIVEICNIALSHIRVGSINSLNEGSIAAQTCKLLYPLYRDMMLENHDFGFNNCIEPLALLTTDVFDWVYAYQYPGNCTLVNRILPNYQIVENQEGIYTYREDWTRPKFGVKDSVPFKIINIGENKIICCNEEEAHADFRKKTDNPNLYTTHFILALSHILAANCAVALCGEDKGRALMSDNINQYKVHLNSAIVNDANEQKREEPDSDFILIRN